MSRRLLFNVSLLLVCAYLSEGAKQHTRRLAEIIARRSQGSFQDTILSAHNKYRAMHGVPALSWDASLAATAKGWAQHLAATESFQHSDAISKRMGENLYYSSGRKESKVPGLAVQRWYEEIKDYDFSHPGFGHSTGHFTQVVWKGTTKVGCGMATSSGGRIYVCCNYTPPGNYMGQFKENVLPPQ